MTSGSLWSYYRDKINNVAVNCDDKSFNYNTNIVGKALERSLQPGNQGNAEQTGADPEILKREGCSKLAPMFGWRRTF